MYFVVRPIQTYRFLSTFEPMKGLKIVFWVLWRIWFYILMIIPIVLMFPFLLLSILTESGYPYFFKMARIWAKFVLFGMGFYYKIDKTQEMEYQKSYMIVANHTSMTDIMLMLALTRNPFDFVGKKELSKIPLFGFFYKRTCILVDRSSSKSRMRSTEVAAVFAVVEHVLQQWDGRLVILVSPPVGSGDVAQVE